MDTELIVQIAPDLTLIQAIPHAFTNKYGVIDITSASQRWLTTAVSLLSRNLQSHNRPTEITAVTPRDINTWIQEMSHSNIKSVSANTYLRALKTYYTRLQRNGLTGHNPAQPIDFLPEPPPSPKRIKRATYQKLLQATANHPQEIRDRAVLGTFWGTGCRISELANMNITMLEKLAHGRFAIHIVGKGGRPRYVYLKKRSADMLAVWLAERPASSNPALFLSRRNGRLAPDSISSILHRLRTVAHIPANEPTNAHSFRHAFAIRKLEQGYDLPLVSAWLGHHSPAFTAKVYVIRSELELRKQFFKKP